MTEHANDGLMCRRKKALILLDSYTLTPGAHLFLPKHTFPLGNCVRSNRPMPLTPGCNIVVSLHVAS